MKTRLIIYVGDSTYNSIAHEGIYSSRKAAEKVATSYPNCLATFEEVLEKLTPTKRNIHKALW